MPLQVRHVHLHQAAEYEPSFLVFKQAVSCYSQHLKAWTATQHQLAPAHDHAPWVVGTDAELSAIAKEAVTSIRFDDGYVFVIHAPGKFSMVWSIIRCHGRTRPPCGCSDQRFAPSRVSR